jgi:hypothetical protein
MHRSFPSAWHMSRPNSIGRDQLPAARWSRGNYVTIRHFCELLLLCRPTQSFRRDDQNMLVFCSAEQHVTEAACPRIGAAWVPNTPAGSRRPDRIPSRRGRHATGLDHPTYQWAATAVAIRRPSRGNRKNDGNFHAIRYASRT